MMRQLCLALVGLGLTLNATAGAPQVGDRAPEFELPASDGNTYRLSDFQDREAVILAWFPRAFTRGCTLECRSLAQNGHLLDPYEASYFMASVDPLEDNQAFAEAQGANFPLLSDADRQVAGSYGVLGSHGVANRWTFYIDREGYIVRIDRDIEPERAAENMVAHLNSLGIPRRGSDKAAHD